MCRNFSAYSFGIYSGCTLQGKVPSDFSHVNRIVQYTLRVCTTVVGLFGTEKLTSGVDILCK